MPQLSHPQPVDPARCLSRIIQRYQRVVITTVALSKVLRADVGRERPDVPRADAEDVSHSAKVSCSVMVGSSRVPHYSPMASAMPS
jgi:hypothetical protein